MSDQLTLVYRFRVVAVRSEEPPRWWQRWRWAVEEEWMGKWDLRKAGWALTREGAVRRARTAIVWIGDHSREEQVIAVSRTYSPRERVPSPLPAELLDNQGGVA